MFCCWRRRCTQLLLCTHQGCCLQTGACDIIPLISTQLWQFCSDPMSIPWMSSLNVQYLLRYLLSRRKALTFAKSSNWIRQSIPYLWREELHLLWLNQQRAAGIDWTNHRLMGNNSHTHKGEKRGFWLQRLFQPRRGRCATALHSTGRALQFVNAELTQCSEFTFLNLLSHKNTFQIKQKHKFAKT